MLLAIVLLLSPWKGPSLPTVTPHAAAYGLTVRGAPRAQVALAALGVPAGWIAAFCTHRLCSPSRFSLRLDGAGRGAVEFEVIRTDPRAARHATIRVTAGGAARTITVRN